ncbi:MAG: hypothetical protein IKN15_01860 [Bacteroidaceae bacterium]|nr:hypothetical protein [Bacteroidaceae bacterium]
MKFRSDYSEESKDYLVVWGVYFHGKIEKALGTDIALIAKADAEPFRLLVNESDGIDRMKVEVEGYPGKAVLYAWKASMGLPMVANPSFEMLQFRGLIVDPSDKKMLADAKKKFKEKRQFL